MMSTWPAETIQKIAATDDLHIAPFRPDGKTTGTLTWIWSVVVDGRLFVRAWNGLNGRWYRSAIAQQAGRVTAAGQAYEVAFDAVTDKELNDRIDTGNGKRIGLVKDRYQKKNSRTGLWDKYNKRGDYVGTKKTGGPFKAIVRLVGRNPKRG